MKGEVFRRGQTWSYRVDLPRKSNGKRNQKIKGGFRTKGAAQAALTALINQINTSQYIEPAKMKVQDFFESWLEDSVAHNNKKSTLSSYRYLLNRHVYSEIGGLELANLQPMHLQQLYRNKLKNGRVDGKGGLSPTSVRRIHAVLHKGLATAVKLQLIRTNPAEAVDAPRQVSNEMLFLTKEEVELFLEEVSYEPYKALYLTAILTGLRRGELLALRWKDIDFGRREASIRQSYVKLHDGTLHLDTTKTKGSDRTVALSTNVIETLKAHKVAQATERLKLGPSYESDDLVFANKKGGPIHPSNLRRNFKNTLKKAGLPEIRFHDLRHTHATLMLKEGVHAKIVSERLGHASIQITLDTYSHVLPNLQSEAADKLDKALFGPSKSEDKVEEERASYLVRAAI